MNEHDLIKAMEEDFKGQYLGAFWRKIHGSKFQAGFPDVVAALPDVASLTEFKWCTEDRHLMGPFSHMVVSLLTGLQYVELKMLGSMGDSCPLRARVLIGCPVECEDGRNFEMAFGFDAADVGHYGTFSALDVINVAIHARSAVNVRDKWQWDPKFFPHGQPRGLEFQLRPTPSKEEWRVGQLVLGMKRYKVFDVRSKIDDAAMELYES